LTILINKPASEITVMASCKRQKKIPQQIGGNTKDIPIGLQKNNVDLIPVTVHEAPRMIHFYKKDSIEDLKDPDLPNDWKNFYRSDDLAATGYYYLI